jgi:FlgO protein
MNDKKSRANHHSSKEGNMKNNRTAIASLLLGTTLLQACTSSIPLDPPRPPLPTRLQCESLIGGANKVPQTPPGSTYEVVGAPVQPIDSADNLVWIHQARVATDRLACGIPPQLRGEGPILMATLVDINSMKAEAQFGRVISEQVGNRLARLGYPVMEMRLRDEIAIQEQTGEIMLSRQAQELAKAHKTPLAVVGTYTETISRTVVNLRAVRVTDGVVISSSDFSIKNDADVLNMLGTAAGVTKEAREAARPVQVREFKVRP